MKIILNKMQATKNKRIESKQKKDENSGIHFLREKF